MGEIKLKRIMILGDVHSPYEDKRGWRLALKIAKTYKPDILIQTGDFADMFSVSAHDKDPNRKNDLEWEISETVRRREELDSIGANKKIITLGNHCYRLERYLMKKAPELFNSVKVDKLLGFTENGWTVVPYREHIKIGKLYLSHESGNSGPYAAHKALDTFGGNIVHGHNHQLVTVYRGNAKGESHVGITAGWLGSLDSIDYMHKVKSYAWQLGIVLGCMEKSGVVHLHAVPFINYKAVVNGRLIIG